MAIEWSWIIKSLVARERARSIGDTTRQSTYLEPLVVVDGVQRLKPRPGGHRALRLQPAIDQAQCFVASQSVSPLHENQRLHLGKMLPPPIIDDRPGEGVLGGVHDLGEERVLLPQLPFVRSSQAQ